ncbi:hypothetical protein ACN4EB_08675 [Corynebacterium macclintockiae]|uniref:hypothetical protein n=1 Tax=Corynebacterium macclintockiae TaxID=2913501 RepID=UPI003EBF6948
MSNYGNLPVRRAGNDPIAQRKAEVRKHSRNIQIAGAVGAVSLVGGLTILPTTFFAIIVPLLAVAFIAYSGFQIKGIVEHKDQW